MKTTCPNCGAPLEFRFDDSFVRVCDSCKSAVLRTDRALETLGQVADLMPSDSPLKLFAEVKDPNGAGTILLVGMAQLQHSAGGSWTEWYGKGDAGWVWISEAQGRFYVTTELADADAPALGGVDPGDKVTLAGIEYTASEVDSGTYAAARGEIPFKLVPGAGFVYADLADGNGNFATIDWGEVDDDDAKQVFVGRQVTYAQLAATGGEDQPEAAPRGKTSEKLACPNCSGALELRAPDATMRIGCPYCGALVDVSQGNLRVLAQLKKPTILIPLGSKCNFGEGELQVIGMMQRSAGVDGAWYPFYEYLLYAKELGFRWLVSSDEHWSYVQPIATGAVDPRGDNPLYDGVGFKLFQNAKLRVDAVYGEMYWKVAAGDKVTAQDYIAPPAMLSVESDGREENWSLSSYKTIKQVKAAFPDTPLELPQPSGVAPNQVAPTYGYGWPALVCLLVFFVVGVAKCKGSNETIMHQQTFSIPPGQPARPAATAEDPTPEQPGNVVFSEKFHLDANKNVQFMIGSDVDNSWLYAAIDLVNDKTGQVVSFDDNVEYYHGYEDGESWSEGSRTSEQLIGPQPAGDYLMRVESMHGATGVANLSVIVSQDVFRYKYFFYGLLMLGLPIFIWWWRARSFHKAQWENSNTIIHAGDDDD